MNAGNDSVVGQQPAPIHFVESGSESAVIGRCRELANGIRVRRTGVPKIANAWSTHSSGPHAPGRNEQVLGS